MSDLAKFLEHTILKPDTTLQDVNRLCEEALRFSFASVCIPPPFVKEARRVLGDRIKVRLATVIGYPMGYATIAAKSEEIKRAMEDGANEINAVLNIAFVKSGLWNGVSRDIDGLSLAAQTRGGTLKLILECNLLTNSELKKVCDIAANAGVPWLETGTGFQGLEPSPEVVKTLRAIADPKIKLQASGGIHMAETARALIEAGADRIGSTNCVKIVAI